MLLAAGGSGAAQDANPSFHLEMNVDRLLVPVMVRDRQGHTINDLKNRDGAEVAARRGYFMPKPEKAAKSRFRPRENQALGLSP